jgi:hypothetical protein
MTLNLNSVRSLHGKHTINRLYKQRESIESADQIYKPKTKKIPKTITDEKANTLF